MKVCHVAHGVMPIPPTAWGAVEAVVADYNYWLNRLGHEVFVVNTPDLNDVERQVNAIAPDVVHVHCERFFGLAERFSAPVRIICSHWPWLFEKASDREVLDLLAGSSYICCLSDRTYRHLLRLGIPADRLFVTINGARSDLFRIDREPLHADRSVCLAAVTERKRQFLIQDIECIDFIGPKQSLAFDYSRPNYVGEWTRPQIYNDLTAYANLVLLSASEVAPLATCEALMAGLGVVVSEAAAGNLDRSKPFITIIPEERTTDVTYVRQKVIDNRRIAIRMRPSIREYAESAFDWKHIVGEYANRVSKILHAV